MRISKRGEKKKMRSRLRQIHRPDDSTNKRMVTQTHTLLCVTHASNAHTRLKLDCVPAHMLTCAQTHRLREIKQVIVVWCAGLSDAELHSMLLTQVCSQSNEPHANQWKHSWVQICKLIMNFFYVTIIIKKMCTFVFIQITEDCAGATEFLHHTRNDEDFLWPQRLAHKLMWAMQPNLFW